MRMGTAFTTAAASSTDLTVRGAIPAPLVAIVGTRTPSPDAATAAFAVARLLAETGIGVVSGLALGIDAAAHRGCLAGGGRTVAVLGHGLDAAIYPAQHAALAEVIAQRGALVSPFPPETLLTRATLLARNRWIAELASAVWVVQTGTPGGALAAAAHARRQGIPVLTTPWAESRWQSGCHALTKYGAETIEIHAVAVRLEQLCTHAPSAERQGVLAM